MTHHDKHRERLSDLLERYYAGLSTTDEEIELYLLLADAPPSSPYYTDAQMLRLQFADNACARSASTPALSPVRRPWLGRLVAALLLMIGAGVWVHRSVRQSDLMASSYIDLPEFRISPASKK